MRENCKTCDGSGEVHSHNPTCWDCNGIGYLVNGKAWKCPNGTSEYCKKAFVSWNTDGTIYQEETMRTDVTISVSGLRGKGKTVILAIIQEALGKDPGLKVSTRRQDDGPNGTEHIDVVGNVTL